MATFVWIRPYQEHCYDRRGREIVSRTGTDASVYAGHHYVVRGGDTLWSIAAREYGSGADLRRAVFEIGGANGLRSSSVQPGQQLTLPYLGD